MSYVTDVQTGGHQIRNSKSASDLEDPLKIAVRCHERLLGTGIAVRGRARYAYKRVEGQGPRVLSWVKMEESTEKRTRREPTLPESRGERQFAQGGGPME